MSAGAITVQKTITWAGAASEGVASEGVASEVAAEAVGGAGRDRCCGRFCAGQRG